MMKDEAIPGFDKLTIQRQYFLRGVIALNKILYQNEFCYCIVVQFFLRQHALRAQVHLNVRTRPVDHVTEFA